MHLLRKDADFEAFQHVMIEAHHCHSIRIRSYSVLSNHWHFVVWPETDGQVTKKKGLFASGSLSSLPRRA
jgi:putative transposase